MIGRSREAFPSIRAVRVLAFGRRLRLPTARAAAPARRCGYHPQPVEQYLPIVLLFASWPCSPADRW